MHKKQIDKAIGILKGLGQGHLLRTPQGDLTYDQVNLLFISNGLKAELNHCYLKEV